jgi:hypothetical protein
MSLRSLVATIDRIPPPALLGINIGLACFVALAHGGALAVSYIKPTPETDGIRQTAAISLPLAAIVIATAIAALFRSGLRRPMLAIHGLVLIASATYLLVYAVNLLVTGIPKGNFAWMVGLLTFWVWYSFFVLTRFSIPEKARGWAPVFYSPLIALAIVSVIDVGVFVQFLRNW